MRHRLFLDLFGGEIAAQSLILQEIFKKNPHDLDLFAVVLPSKKEIPHIW